MALTEAGQLEQANFLYDTTELRAILCNGTWGESSNPSEQTVLLSEVLPDRPLLVATTLEWVPASNSLDVQISSTSYTPSANATLTRWAIVRDDGILQSMQNVQTITPPSAGVGSFTLASGQTHALLAGDRVYFAGSEFWVTVTGTLGADEYSYSTTETYVSFTPTKLHAIRGLIIAVFQPSQSGFAIAGEALQLIATGGALNV
jgi:hypothetical protein